MPLRMRAHGMIPSLHARFADPTSMRLEHLGRCVRVSFDSNAWEAVFGPEGAKYAPIHAALAEGRIEGFVCAAGFRIEAVTKRDRPSYFAQPHMAVAVGAPVAEDGVFHFSMSLGPDDARHPGLPLVQAGKLRRALAAGVRLMYGENWMGLPVPAEVRDPALYVAEDARKASEREDRQHLASTAIDARGIGKAAFDAADGWTDRPRTLAEEKKLVRACAEWADGELVAAHVAYGNDLLCTNDRARSAGRSVFDVSYRTWLAATYGIMFLTVEELAAKVSR